MKNGIKLTYVMDLRMGERKREEKEGERERKKEKINKEMAIK